jgi:hypothetical protein
MRSVSSWALPLVVLEFLVSCGGTGSAGAAATGATGGGATSSVSAAATGSGVGGATGSASVSAAGSTGSAGTGGAGGAGSCDAPGGYDHAVLCDLPIAFWAMNKASGTEPDLTAGNNTGTYKGAPASLVALPNGDQAADFNGSNAYLTVPSNASLSIATTGDLTWEGWLRPDVLQFPHDDGSSGYVDWMGKCESFGPTCEWEARMYDTATQESPNRPNRLSAYVFNPSAGLGSSADWQPIPGLIKASEWLHVVGEYTTHSQPADCPDPIKYPGSITIWVNGVPWDHASHGDTGCMSQYKVVPVANGSALNIGTMAKDSWFKGAIGKVAVYDHLLGQARITHHYQTMTGKLPTGSCADTCSL